MDLTSTDRIRLSVPAATSAVRIVRAGAAGLATRAGFTYHEVEQIQLAVGEAAALLAPETGEGTLVVSFDIGPGGLVVEPEVVDAGATPPVAADAATRAGGADEVPAIASAVLDAAVDEWRVEADGRRIVLRKALGETDLDDE